MRFLFIKSIRNDEGVNIYKVTELVESCIFMSWLIWQKICFKLIESKLKVSTFTCHFLISIPNSLHLLTFCTCPHIKK